MYSYSQTNFIVEFLSQPTPTSPSGSIISGLNADLLDINALLAQKGRVEVSLEKIVGPPLPKKTNQDLIVPPAVNHWDHLLKEMVSMIVTLLQLNIYLIETDFLILKCIMLR